MLVFGVVVGVCIDADADGFFLVISIDGDDDDDARCASSIAHCFSRNALATRRFSSAAISAAISARVSASRSALTLRARIQSSVPSGGVNRAHSTPAFAFSHSNSTTPLFAQIFIRVFSATMSPYKSHENVYGAALSVRRAFVAASINQSFRQSSSKRQIDGQDG